MSPWEKALAVFADVAADSEVTWMVIGSAATRLHGVVAIGPGDVDVLVHPETADAALRDLARRLTEATDQSRGGGDDLGTFTSTAEQPLLDSGAWTFGRWSVDGFKLELARIREDVGARLLETQGTQAWHHRRTLAWRGREVPVVALELQWATMKARGQQDRLAAVAGALAVDRDGELARQALAARGLEHGAGDAETLLANGAPDDLDELVSWTAQTL